MRQATVLKPFTTDLNEMCINGDVVYLDGTKVYFNRRFLGNYNTEDVEFKIEKEWN